MEFINVLKNRRSTRKFLDKKVSKQLIKEVIELANSSPSAGNIQARSIVIVNNSKIINEIRKTAKGLMNFEREIPVLLIILAKPKESGERYGNRGETLYALQDATILASYIQLVAVSRGLATCWVGYFEEKKVSQILKLSNDVRPVAMIPLGYPFEKVPAKERKKLNEIILKEV